MEGYKLIEETLNQEDINNHDANYTSLNTGS